MEEKRETVGALSSELLQKEAPTQDPIELEREMHRDYEKNVIEAIERGKKDFIGDFYVVVLTKRERLMENVLRNYFSCRSSCPTPEWDQTVYKFDRRLERIIILWTIPCKDACTYLAQYALEVAPEERGLLRYVLEFHDGTLLKLAKQMNGEKEDSILLDK